MSQMKPMLAEHFSEEHAVFPYYASPKIDGFRCFNDSGQALTRSRKPQNNAPIREALSIILAHGLDGELVAGSVNDPLAFQKTGALRNKTVPVPDWSWNLFDDFRNPTAPFVKRLESAAARCAEINDCIGEERVFHVEHVEIGNLDELLAYEAAMTADGYEGIMLRDPNGVYKYGRSTVKENALLKVKRFDHDEAVVIDFVELMHNENESFENELGRTARSSHQENLVASGRLGALVCKSPKWAEPFRVSCGSMTWEQQAYYWRIREQLRDRFTRFKHFSHGAKDKPRHGIWDGWREAWDMDPDDVRALIAAKLAK